MFTFTVTLQYADLPLLRRTDIVAVPYFLAVTTPLEFTETISGQLELKSCLV